MSKSQTFNVDILNIVIQSINFVKITFTPAPLRYGVDWAE